MKKSTELAYKYNLTDAQIEKLWYSWWKSARETVTRYYDKKGKNASSLNIMFKPIGQLMFSERLEHRYKKYYDRKYKKNQTDVNSSTVDEK